MPTSSKSVSSASATKTKMSTAESSTDTKDTSRKIAFTSWKSQTVMIITVVAVSLGLFVILLFLFRKNTSSEGQLKNATKGNPDVCQTQSCVAAGKALFESINFTINPCDDFYEYACGNWIAHHPIPSDKSHVGALGLLGDKLTKELGELLEQKPKGSVSKSLQFALDIYRECTNKETREERGHAPVKQKLTKMLGTSWPILNQNSKNDPLSFADFAQTWASFKHVAIKSITGFGFTDDANKTDTKIIWFGSTDLIFRARECANQTKYAIKFAAQRKLMLDYGKLFTGKDGDEKRLQERFEEMVEFECKLASFIRPAEQSRDAKSWYNKMSLAAFRNITSNRFDGLSIIHAYTAPFKLSYSVNDTEMVVVADIPFYQKMSQLLQTTPARVLLNYWGFLFIKKFSSYTDSKLYEITFESAKATSGIQTAKSLSRQCYTYVYSNFHWALSQLYVDLVVAPDTKERAEELVADLKAAFKEIVQKEATWLDEATRARTLEKAAATNYYVAYPDWIRDNARIDEIHYLTGNDSIQVKKGQYFETVIELMLFNAVNSYRKLREPRNVRLDWDLPPANPNAAAKRTSNDVSIPAGILFPPCFDPGRPAYLNYGAIGAVIGHEITHHFDDQGSQHDKKGNLVNWWTPETKKRFEDGAKCFIEQYGSIVDKTTGLKLNGIKTQGENIADNGGIREAFLAYQTLAKKRPQPLVPQMEFFTREQMFFLSWASVWCKNSLPQAMMSNIENGAHSLSMYRVNVPLGNFNEFTKAFKCPSGSKMNPAKKCQLW